MSLELDLSVQLRGGDLDAAFPFYLAITPDERVVTCGSALRQLLPALDGEKLSDTFAVTVSDGSPLGASPHAEVELRSMANADLVLRGQVLQTGARGMMLFVGAPRVSPQAMASLGLSTGAYAPLDGARYYESLVEAASSDLASVQKSLEREHEDRTRMEDELRLAQRLEAVGQLAAGVAHEINTPIQYVGDSVFFLKDAFGDLMQLVRDMKESAPKDIGDEHWDNADADFLIEQVPKAIERMVYGVDRVASIVRAMKAFAHPGTDTKEPSNINEALQTTLTVSRNEYKYVADVETQFADLPLVPCNLGELNQVFLNLVVNAAHAIGSANEGTERRGTITVRTRLEDTYVAIDITDTGTGIPEHVRGRIFDPFFTTKPVGKGTGQGLPIARNIIVKHNGTLTYDTEMGKGTTFSIRLPLAEGDHGSGGTYSLRG